MVERRKTNVNGESPCDRTSHHQTLWLQLPTQQLTRSRLARRQGPDRQTGPDGDPQRALHGGESFWAEGLHSPLRPELSASSGRPVPEGH
jgi:hypothetical protein